LYEILELARSKRIFAFNQFLGAAPAPPKGLIITSILRLGGSD
jgi:hypothetical protein